MSATVKWIVAIVSLLAANMLAMVILIVASRSSTAGVIPDYYTKAAHFDDAIAQRAANRALGWPVAVSLARDEIVVRSVAGARVHINGFPRAHAERVLDLVLTGDGVYRGALPAPAMGWHELTVTVTRGADRVVETLSIEAAP